MAQAAPSIFNKKATEKLRSPDDLDKYVRVTNPSVWVILAASIALLVGLLSWGFFGSVTTSVQATGAYIDGSVVCFLSAENVKGVQKGQSANVNNSNEMKVESVSPVPFSREEAGYVLKNDYLVSTLLKSDWAYCVTLEGDKSGLSEYVPLEVSIMTERITPISLILRNWG